MLFNSDVFIKAFLPAIVLLALLIQRLSPRALPWLLIGASLFFYGYWKPAYLLILLASGGTNFSLSWMIYRSKSSALLGLGIAINLGLLGYFKYLGWLSEGLQAAGLDWFAPKTYLLPLAISFYTFEQISYLVDCWKGIVSPASLRDYGFFVTFFPKLIAGPIVRFAELRGQIGAARITTAGFAAGITLFIIGLAKKILLADQAALYVAAAFDTAKAGSIPAATDAWLGSLAYTLQIYFDFSGYSDMAIGLGLLFGIHLPINFYSPYKATSIIEFWRRWHMTLSRFLRDYIYFPLGGSRLGQPRRYVNLILVMAIGGLWHGAGLTFVVWGLLHGTYLAVNHLFRHYRRPAAKAAPAASLAAWALTFLAVLIAWVFFRANSLASAGRVLAGMLGLGSGTVLGETAVFAAATVAALLVVALLLPNSNQLIGLDRLQPDAATDMLIPRDARPSWLQWQPRPGWGIAVGALAVGLALSLSHPSPFLYFQF